MPLLFNELSLLFLLTMLVSQGRPLLTNGLYSYGSDVSGVQVGPLVIPNHLDHHSKHQCRNRNDKLAFSV